MVKIIASEDIKTIIEHFAHLSKWPSDIAVVDAAYLHKAVGGGEYDYSRGIEEARKAVLEGQRVILFGHESLPRMCLSKPFQRLIAEHPDKIRYQSVAGGGTRMGEMPKAFDVPQYKNPALLFSADRKDGETAQGMYFPGMFCDAEALLQKEYTNQQLAEELEKYALENPVNLWAPIWSMVGLKAQAADPRNVRYPVLSKWHFRGAEVEMALDNMQQPDFERAYEIKAREFRKV